MKVRLTDWAILQNISYTTTFRWAKAGKIPGLHRAASGRLFVEVQSDGGGDGGVLYGRVSAAEQREDFGRQMARLRDFAAARGLVVARGLRARSYGRRSAANRARRAVTAASAAP